MLNSYPVSYTHLIYDTAMGKGWIRQSLGITRVPEGLGTSANTRSADLKRVGGMAALLMNMLASVPHDLPAEAVPAPSEEEQDVYKRQVKPYVKDFTAGEGERAEQWEKRFDLSHWAFFMAFDGEHPVGAAAVASRTEGVQMLAGRDDLAVLWDIRVEDACKRQGVGQKLFDMAVNWSRDQGLVQIKIECQNNNIPAIQFYHKDVYKRQDNSRFYAKACSAYFAFLAAGLALMLPCFNLLFPVLIGEAYREAFDTIPLFLIMAMLSAYSTFVGNIFYAIRCV